ncbi:ABC transporter ATP-binding protein [Natrialbaceae archaeon A-CW3]
MTEVTLENLTKVYSDSQGTETAVDDLSLTIDDGEFIVIVGPSGCGKSTTLRMLAGLETATEGRILFGDEEVQKLGPAARDIAMVFQNYALYPSMSAKENIGYGLKHSTNLSKEEREELVVEAAQMLGIESILDQTPDEMSGGQKQRVALGRAIVREPSVFLLDEPLSNLDAKLRSNMRHEIQRIQSELGITAIYVTHDQKEAMTMADRIVIINDGVMQQIAPPETLYNEPTNQFVAQFIGSPAMNTFEAAVDTDSSDHVVTYQGVELCSFEPPSTVETLSTVTVGVRPEHMGITTEPGNGRLAVDVVVAEYQGKTNFVHVELDGRSMTARTDPEVLPERGETVYLDIDPADIYCFEQSSGDTVKHRTSGRAVKPGHVR